ncbi:hypothetical protein F8M41_003896 [Gigaspora margarita]|uniref:Uncharacterized protein n=1 Tax=Gigaspora margarita TaxID=4874 RepID=A0A8H4AXX8_GIGMA|nr:hypothetical protein F8M41_003896 [Gigaspora margarita]
MAKSINHLDDILELTEEGQKYVIQIQQELVSDLCVWHWVFYCAGNRNCQRACGGFENCTQNCSNYALKNNLKMHIPRNVSVQHESAITRLNLSRNVRDKVILSRHADGYTVKEIKLKLLAPFNSMPKEQLEQQEQYGTNVRGQFCIE